MEEHNVKLAITPFEKNIEVWKQLWRVIEKSDLLLQIVDARIPHFFYSADLEKYIKEVGENKEFILCINKADYLSPELIQHWNQYFKEKKVTHIFISAKQEQEKLDVDAVEEADEDDESDGETQHKEEEEKEFEPMFADLKKKIDLENEAKELGQEDNEEGQEPAQQRVVEFNTPTVFTRDDMLQILNRKAKSLNKDSASKLMVGTVGYPNVGKSSLINVLCGRKRVGVAAMPGKTKHFQTLPLEDEARAICLVDCPGLVFPSFANSKAEMYCCGVLPIQNLREYVQPISLILGRIPREVLEAYYKVKLPPRDSSKYTTATFLSIFALKKGWITGNSNPHQAEAAKRVLKDYTTGLLVFCHVRPDFDAATHKAVTQSGFDMDLDLGEAELESGRLALDPVAESEDTTKVSEVIQPSDAETTEAEQIVSGLIDGQNQPVADGGAGAGIDEDDLDAEFFRKQPGAAQAKMKSKLNKGEKRALKFLMKRELAETGVELDFNKIAKGGDVAELKAYLATADRVAVAASHKNYVETGGGQKNKNVGARKIGNNSNKLMGYKEFFADEDDSD